MGTKTTSLASITDVASNDVLMVVDKSDTSGSANGTNKQVTKEDLLSGLVPLSYLLTGWYPKTTETWTYKSATEIYISGDVTEDYQPLDKLKLYQSGDKFFIVKEVSVYDAVNDRITITVFGCSDYVVTNNAITDMYWSNLPLPFGFPNYFSISARGYKSGGNQLDLTDSVATKVTLLTEDWDTMGNYDADNSKFIAPIDGDYDVLAVNTFTATVASKLYVSSLRVNDTEMIANYSHSGVAQSLSVPVKSLLHLSAGDYVELFATSYAGVNTVDIIQGTKYTFMEIALRNIR